MSTQCPGCGCHELQNHDPGCTGEDPLLQLAEIPALGECRRCARLERDLDEAHGDAEREYGLRVIAEGERDETMAQAERLAKHALRYRRLLHEQDASSARWAAKTGMRIGGLTVERDEWQARAEKAEALNATLQLHFDNCNADKIVTMTLRAERAEATHRNLAANCATYREQAEERDDAMDKAAAFQKRAERAEALLREVAVALNKLASPATYFERDVAIGLEVVLLDTPIGIAKGAFAKVRDLLEGWNDKG